ncbi:hypothetical protein SAMN05421504_106297 [Amycolatopsis xylanica]|uniref:Uncharacterized protein n=2 Tax=Amycolatopsis xylanica TaxID=589385 RepID=A0A1H3LP83_9PSEU|nr:hypothetical protein SAMN05421504_106297 [Amycolatopsis xylanica]
MVMTAAAAQPPQQPNPLRFDSPRAIRAALLPEEAGEFDLAYQAALKTAAETLSLEQLQATLENWRTIARMTQADPAGHRHLIQQAERGRRTGEPPADSRSWSSLKAELGL